MAAPDIDEIRTGPFKVTFGDVHLGDVTEDGVSVSIAKLKRERKVDRFGEHVIDLIHMGHTVEVTLTMVEYNRENLAIALPMAYAGSGYVDLGRKPGKKYSEEAAVLLIHPEQVADAVTTEDVTIRKAVCTSDVVIPLAAAVDRVLELTFMGLVDVTQTNMKLLAKFAAPDRT